MPKIDPRSTTAREIKYLRDKIDALLASSGTPNYASWSVGSDRLDVIFDDNVTTYQISIKPALVQYR